MSKISEKIIELRESLGWSQSELSRRSGITIETISVLEEGESNPSYETLQRLAYLFDVSLAILNVEMSSNKKTSENKKDIFYRKYGQIDKLSAEDIKMVLILIKRLLNK